MVIVGMDPSRRNWGLVKVELDTYIKQIRVVDKTVIHSKFNGKSKLPKNNLDILEVAELYKSIKAFIGYPDAVVAELPVGSQSASAMASYGICTGIYGALFSEFKSQMIIRNLEIKSLALGRPLKRGDVVDKSAVIDYVNGIDTNLLVNVKNSDKEHIADAYAAILVALGKGIVRRTQFINTYRR